MDGIQGEGAAFVLLGGLDGSIAYQCSRNLLDHQIWATL